MQQLANTDYLESGTKESKQNQNICTEVVCPSEDGDPSQY